MHRFPLITIAIPVFNGQSGIKNALESAKQQSYPNLEIIVSDNNSSDSTYEILTTLSNKDPRIKLYKRKHTVSAGQNFRELVYKARGEYFFWLSHDDTIEANFILDTFSKIYTDPNIIGCCSNVKFFTTEGIEISDWTRSFTNIRAMSENVAKRISQVFQRIGWYAIYSLWRTSILKKSKILLINEYHHGFDVVFIAEMLRYGKLERVDTHLFNYTVDRSKDYAKGDRREIAKFKYLSLAVDILTFIIKDTTLNWEDRIEFLHESCVNILSTTSEFRGHVLSELKITSPNNGSISINDFIAVISDSLGIEISISKNGHLSFPRQRRALIFMPHCPLPPKTGAHKRFLQTLNTLRELDFDITIATTDLYADQKWGTESIELFKRVYPNIKLEMYRHQNQDLYWITENSNHKHFNSTQYSPPGLKKFFHDIQNKIKPQVVLINYTLWSDLITENKSTNTKYIVDLHDIITLNNYLRQSSAVNQTHCNEVNNTIENNLDYSHELKSIKSFDTAIAISINDYNLFAKQLSNSSTSLVYLSYYETEMPQYTFSPTIESVRFVFVGSDNPFNIQGVKLFIENILPIIKATDPKFELHIYGNCSNHFRGTDSIKCNGYVNSIDEIYTKTTIAVVPLINATGQQIKVMEAVSRGIPVIIFNCIATANGIVNGINGICCETHAEFANACLSAKINPSALINLACKTKERVLREKLKMKYQAEKIFDA